MLASSLDFTCIVEGCEAASIFRAGAFGRGRHKPLDCKNVVAIRGTVKRRVPRKIDRPCLAAPLKQQSRAFFRPVARRDVQQCLAKLIPAKNQTGLRVELQCQVVRAACPRRLKCRPLTHCVDTM